LGFRGCGSEGGSYGVDEGIGKAVFKRNGYIASFAFDGEAFDGDFLFLFLRQFGSPTV